MKMMMKVVAALVVGLVSMFSNHAYAADEGTLKISGTVDAVANVAIFNAEDSTEMLPAGYTTLNLATGMAAVQIATIREQCNDVDGYTMTLKPTSSTTNDSFLNGVEDGAKVAYTLSYGGTAVTLSGGQATVTSTSAINDGYPLFTSKTLLITIADDSEATTPNTGVFGKNHLHVLPADTYSDTLTFTIAAKA